MERRTWKSVEIINGDGAEKFRTFLKGKGFTYEPSACFNYIHFEVYCNKAETMEINNFLDKLARPEEKFMNIETGDVYTESELRNLYEEFKADWSETEKEIYADFDYWLNSALDRNGSLIRI